MTKGERFIIIRNSMFEPIRFNVEVSYTEDQEPSEEKELRGSKTGDGWGQPKVEHFVGLTGAQVDHLCILLAVSGIKVSIRVHQVGKD